MLHSPRTHKRERESERKEHPEKKVTLFDWYARVDALFLIFFFAASPPQSRPSEPREV